MSAARTLSQKMTEIDRLIRAGDLRSAGRILKRINAAKIPVPQLAKYGALCRRTGLYYRGLLALTPPLKRERLENTSPAHRAEYALLLQRRGVIDEALRILAAIDPRKLPEVSLYRAYCLFNQWRYREAIPLLRDYVARAEPGYQRLVGTVNLCAALVATGGEARATLETAYRQAHAGGHRRLEANCLELQAQLHIERGELTAAEEALLRAEALLNADQDQDTLFIRKWRAIASALRTQDPAPLRAYRADLAKAIEYETLRSLDLYELRIRFDEKLFHRLYFGTPFPEYRARIEKYLRRKPLNDVFPLGDSRATKALDLRDGEQLRKIGLKPGTKTHAVLRALLRDLYQPARIGRIFSEVFPDERFHPATSPVRVRMLISRTQRLLRAARLPVRIVSGKRGYTIEVRGDFHILIPREWPDHWQTKLGLLPPSQPCSFAELKAHLDLTDSQARAFIGRALDRGVLIRSGSGRTTRYLRA